MSKVEEIKTLIDALTWQERCELNAMLQNWPDDNSPLHQSFFDKAKEFQVAGVRAP